MRRAAHQLCKLAICFAVICIILQLLERALEPALQETSAYNSTSKINVPHHIEIYSRDPLGEYLWNHLFEGKKELQSDGVTKLGNKSIGGLSFSYNSGNLEVIPPMSAASSIVVLVFDGSTRQEQKEAEKWLNQLMHPRILLLVIQGNPDCGKNQWITKFISSNGAAFVTRGGTIVDNKQIFPWPLGVATYLEFPLFFPDEIDILSERPYMCSFVGTIRQNTTREVIPSLFIMLGLENVCYLKTRNLLAVESLGEYIQILSDSDLTLCPATVFGNSETHCIYEALSLGSVPVVEDTATCGGVDLLKKYNAPLIYVQSLEHNLSGVISNEKRLNLQEKIARRATIVNWYADFRHRMADQFVDVIKSAH